MEITPSRVIRRVLSRWPVVSALLGVAVGAAATSGAILAVAGVAEQAQAARQQELLARGEAVYVTHCQSCHGDRQGIGRQPGVPSHGRDGHTWHHSDQALKAVIRDGAPGAGPSLELMGVSESQAAEILRELGLAERWQGPPMPAWKDVLSEADIEAVLAYIKTFWTPEQRRMQQQAPMMR